MERKSFAVQDVAGNAIRGASVLIKTYPGNVTATLYDDDEVTPISNPMTTDNTGQCFCKAANGHYTQINSKTGIVTETQQDIVFFDPDDLTDAYAAPDGSDGIGHIASGTGAVATTVGAELRRHVNPQQYGAVGDGVTDDTAALLAATQTGKIVDGLDLTYAVTGNFQPHANFVGMTNMTLKQLTPTGSNRRTLSISGFTGFYLSRVYVNRGGNLTGGSIGSDAGIWIANCSKFSVGKIGSTGGGSGNGVSFQSCYDFFDMDVTVHDERYTTNSVPADDVINGIWYNNCYNFISYNPYVYDCGLLLSAVISKRRSRGIVFGGCYNFVQYSPRLVNLDQGQDITGTLGNHDFLISGGIATGCYSYSFKAANSAYRGTYEACVGDGAAINFIASGPTEASNPLPRDITYKRCISLDADKGGASSTGISAAGFRIQSVGTVDATYPRGVIYDNCQAIDTQGSPTMLIGFDCDVATGTAPGDLNKLVNNCRSTGFVTSATNGFTDVNSLTGLYRFDGAAPRLVLLETDAPSNEKNWDTSLVAGDLSRRTRTDADGTGETFELIQRTGTVVDLIRWSATAMRRGSVVDSARYEEADSSGRITRRYSDNSLQNIDTWQNFGIAATGQGLAQTGTFGAGGVSGASAWKIEFAATADWASAGNRSAKITYKVALAGSLVSVLDINPSVGLSILTAGLGLAIKEGSNARSGTSVMIGGTVTVSNTSVSANTRIHYSRTTTGGTVGHVSTTQVNGTSFTLNSSSATETSTFNWFLVEAT